ncbi:MAG: alanyl-tRNA editing protein [Patescibacteria group bacterium]
MKTQQLYLLDSYAKEMAATILEVVPEGEKRFRVMLDSTVFYPMGGGQPTDQGMLTSDSWSGNVYQVMTKDGEIWHYVESEAAPTVGVKVHGVLNWDRRFRHMRLHSAGHMVDFAMYLLGYSPKQLVPTKGDHGKKPYIIYMGVLGKDIANELEEKSNELVAQSLTLSVSLGTLEEITKDAIYLQPGLPINKQLRKLTLEGVGSVADGGTQVERTREIGKITIPSVVEENGQTIVSYQIS